ncbi:hypothetical protein [Bifidobacterium moukalabense]|uniref:hypothetical protein n=1 Tax=Bifidobacterium moukalabense TaxID=1333651 RepID=UPI0010F4CAFE|nr:hypothetical protein [Bifidobacterium moukalabense]
MDALITLVHQHPVAILVIVFAITVIGFAAYVGLTLRNGLKASALSAKPLSLIKEQIKHCSVKWHWNPSRITFTIPAIYTSDEEINKWADTVAPRLGMRFQPTEVRIIPRKFYRSARYEVTFTKLRRLR